MISVRQLFASGGRRTAAGHAKRGQRQPVLVDTSFVATAFALAKPVF